MVTHSNITQQGRFGNQLFQIAAAVGLAIKNNDVAKFYPWPHQHAFKIGIDETLQHSEIKANFLEKGFHYTPIPYQPGLDISGYFQSRKYFAHCEPHIRKIFEFKVDLVPTILKDIAKGACSIHVRRGDYVQISNFHPPVSLEYLEAAIRIIKREYNINRFLVFSDDIEWCKNNLYDHTDMVYITDQTPEKDMALMSYCDHHIIANSSFSWWGAYLGKNLGGKKVIYPANWFGPDNVGASTKDLIPFNWEGIA